MNHRHLIAFGVGVAAGYFVLPWIIGMVRGA